MLSRKRLARIKACITLCPLMRQISGYYVMRFKKRCFSHISQKYIFLLHTENYVLESRQPVGLIRKQPPKDRTDKGF